MGTFVFKIGSTVYDLGIVKNISTNTINNKLILDAVVPGQTAQVINSTESRKQFILNCRYYGSESSFNTLESALNTAEQNNTACKLQRPWDSSEISVTVYNSNTISTGGRPNTFDFILTLDEAISLL